MLRRSQAQKDKYVFSQIWNLDLRKKEQTWNRKVERWLGERGRRTQDSEEVVNKIKVDGTHYFVQLPHGNAGKDATFCSMQPSVRDVQIWKRGLVCLYAYVRVLLWVQMHVYMHGHACGGHVSTLAVTLQLLATLNFATGQLIGLQSQLG